MVCARMCIKDSTLISNALKSNEEALFRRFHPHLGTIGAATIVVGQGSAL